MKHDSGLTPTNKGNGSTAESSDYAPLSIAPHLQHRPQYNPSNNYGGYNQSSSSYPHPNQFYKQQNMAYYDNSGYGSSSYARAPSIGDTMRDTVDVELNKTLQQITGCINLIQKLRPDLLSREKPNDLIMCRYHLMQFMQKVDRMYESDARGYKPIPPHVTNYYGAGGAPANNVVSNNSNARPMHSFLVQQPQQQLRGPGYDTSNDQNKQQHQQLQQKGALHITRAAPAPVNMTQVQQGQTPPTRTSNPRTIPPLPDEMQISHDASSRRDYASNVSSDDPILSTSSNSSFVDLETFLDAGTNTPQIQIAMNLDGSPPGSII